MGKSYKNGIKSEKKTKLQHLYKYPAKKLPDEGKQMALGRGECGKTWGYLLKK